jgi:hypothetical protein
VALVQPFVLAPVLGLLLADTLAGCSTTPAERETNPQGVGRAGCRARRRVSTPRRCLYRWRMRLARWCLIQRRGRLRYFATDVLTSSK